MVLYNPKRQKQQFCHCWEGMAPSQCSFCTCCHFPLPTFTQDPQSCRTANNQAILFCLKKTQLIVTATLPTSTQALESCSATNNQAAPTLKSLFSNLRIIAANKMEIPSKMAICRWWWQILPILLITRKGSKVTSAHRAVPLSGLKIKIEVIVTTTIATQTCTIYSCDSSPAHTKCYLLDVGFFLTNEVSLLFSYPVFVQLSEQNFWAPWFSHSQFQEWPQN